MTNMERGHKPPSRVRYEASHPTVTVRLSAEAHKRLLKLCQTTGKSPADVMREAVGVQEVSAGSAYQKGFQTAMALYAVKWKCRVCGRDITVTSELATKKLAQRPAEVGWIHGDCARKTKPDQKDSIVGAYAVTGSSAVPITKIIRQRPDGSTYVTPA